MTATSKTHDVLIIGGGPAGSFTAYKLARAGLKPLVVDFYPEHKRKLCGEYLCPRGVELLRAEGLSEEILSGFEPIYGMELYSPSGRHISARFPGWQKNMQGVSVQRHIFEQRLRKLAERFGAQFIKNERVLKVDRSGEHWIVHTSQRALRTRFLIGADGRKSIVAKTLNLTKDHGDKKRIALHAYLKPLRALGRMGEMHIFADGSYAGVNPINNHEVNFSVVCDAELIQKHKSLHQIINHYIETSSSLKKNFMPITDAQEVLTVSPLRHTTHNVVGPNAALVGDASGFVDPLTGEGMYFALYGASLLAKHILQAAAQNLFNWQSGLDDYATHIKSELRSKRTINLFFQWLIRRSWGVEFVAQFLQKSRHRADTFIGIIGNVYAPSEGLSKLLLKGDAA